MGGLADEDCTRCDDGARLDREGVRSLCRFVPRWQVVWNHHLERRYELADFRSALDLATAIGELAEEIGHHPDLFLGWGKLGVQIWTHRVGGLTEADFVLAAKIDRLVAARLGARAEGRGQARANGSRA